MKKETFQKKSFSKFKSLFNKVPENWIFAPGRINLIGEHTDYSDGYVLPVAIDLGVFIAMTPGEDDCVELFSIDFEDLALINLTSLEKAGNSWKEYIKGVIWALDAQGFQLKGWQGVISGNIPIGAGLSSSAATEIALIKAFMSAGGFSMSQCKMAQIGRKAEQDWVGVNVGIMDQLISAVGKKGHAVLLDCRSLEYEYVPIPDSIKLFVLDTNTRRELSNSAYNTRQKEVEIAAQQLGVSSLRDASLNLLNQHKDTLTTTLFKRARHVITENERVQGFCEAMKAEDISKMGELINQSHVSLRDDFEVSSNALNSIVEIAQNQPGCFGARMTGAGFGGCALALTSFDEGQNFEDQVHTRYYSATGIKPNIFPVSSGDSVRLLNK